MKLGSILLFITFTQIIALITSLQIYYGISSDLLYRVHPVVGLLISFELAYSGFLIYKGYKNKGK